LDGGVLLISVNTPKALDATTFALQDARRAGKKLAADLNEAKTASKLLQIIPSLDPFLKMADEIASVRACA
jgi:hypothetical protein